MELAELVIELLKYVLPAGLVILGMRLMQQQQLKEKAQEIHLELSNRIGKNHSSLIFHAYERILLFLARMEPDQLLNRVAPASMNALQYAKVLDQNIREEFNHNLAQQLYILPASWDEVVKAQVYVRGFILQAAQSLPEGATGADLHGRMWEMWSHQEANPTLSATMMLKRDIQNFLSGSKITDTRNG